jgi:hypothetical protein
MTKFVTLVILAALRLLYAPPNEQANNAPFSTPLSLPQISANTAIAQTSKIISLKASLNNSKVLLQWAVSENETADQFEVEKSTDGVNYTMTALVFSSDKAETDNYAFYEKAAGKKVLYRIKIINKDKRIEYSDIVLIEPGNVLA